MSLRVSNRLVLYVQENMTTRQGTPYVDFAAFVTYVANKFEVFCTRNPMQRMGTKPVSEVKPSVALSFNSLDDVLTFFSSVLDWTGSKITLELHAVREYDDVAYSFADLWDYTGKETELAVFDEETPSRFLDALRLLQGSRLESVSYSNDRL